MKAKNSGESEHMRELPGAPRERGPLPLHVMAAAAVLAVLGLAMLLGTRRSGKTEAHLAQLRSKGEKLTFRELTGGDAPISNSAPQAVERTVTALTKQGDCPDLDFSAYGKPGSMRVAWKQPTVTVKQSGKTMGWKEVARYLEPAREPLKALREVLESASPEWGRRTNYSQPPIFDFGSLECARWFSVEAISDLHAEELEPALQSIGALGAFARGDTLDYALGSEILRAAVTQRGLWVTWQSLQVEGWSDEQMEQLAGIWKGLDLFEGAEHGLLGERVMGISISEEVRGSKGRRVMRNLKGSSGSRSTYREMFEDWVIWPAYKITRMDADELFYLRVIGRAIDEARQIRAHRRWDAGKSKAVFAAKRKQITAASNRWRYPISGVLLPFYSDILQSTVRTETLRQLTLAAVAIKRYQRRHQSLPPNLAALTPEYLKMPTYDPMSGGPLRYQPGTNGDFLLYSIGEDGQDDGGDPRPPAGGKPGLWEGRDAVWPSAE